MPARGPRGDFRKGLLGEGWAPLEERAPQAGLHVWGILSHEWQRLHTVVQVQAVSVRTELVSGRE